MGAADFQGAAGSERVLVVGPAWVGDMVMAGALVETLHGRFPGSRVEMLAPGWSAPLLARMPGVAAGHRMPLEHGQYAPVTRLQIGVGLRAAGFTRAIIVPRSWKAALVPWAARIPVRTGFLGELRYGLLNDIRSRNLQLLDQTIKQLVALGLEAGAPLPAVLPRPRLQVDHANLERLTERWPWVRHAGLVALLPGTAYGPAKRWPVEHFRDLARRLRVAGSEVMVLGSADERDLGVAICQDETEGIHNLCGITSLGDAVDLLSVARCAVSNDSGLMHVAAATGTHVVALFGSSSPAYTPPLTDRCTLLTLRLECSPCFERECPLGHLRCLRDLAPSQVFAAVERSLELSALTPLGP